MRSYKPIKRNILPIEDAVEIMIKTFDGIDGALKMCLTYNTRESKRIAKRLVELKGENKDEQV